MALLPYVDSTGNLMDGTYFRLLPFCKKNHCNRKCKDYYERLNCADSGSYICPYGLSSYVYTSSIGKLIFTGLRIKGVYDKKKARAIETNEYVFNPVIGEASCQLIAHETYVSDSEKHKLEEKLEAIRDLLHETRSLNGQIRTSIDSLWENTADDDSTYLDPNMMMETLKNVQISSIMISSRFSYFDSILNPSLPVGNVYSAIIFKKFDKMRKLLRGYKRKNVWVKLNTVSQSNYQYNINSTFETLLFIILENAIKYSPDNNPVNVYFDEDNNVLDVTISSIGPYCDDNEILHLCDKGFRGENAKDVDNTGQGFGLNFAKKICDSHNIGIAFNSEYTHKDHGIKYGKFSVKLHFDNNMQCGH